MTATEQEARLLLQRIVLGGGPVSVLLGDVELFLRELVGEVEWVRCAEGNYPEFAERYAAQPDRRVTKENGWFQAWMPVTEWDVEEDGPVPAERRTEAQLAAVR